MPLSPPGFVFNILDQFDQQQETFTISVALSRRLAAAHAERKQITYPLRSLDARKPRPRQNCLSLRSDQRRGSREIPAAHRITSSS